MQDSKYVVIEIQGLETAFLFPNWMQHADVAQAFLRGYPGREVISAGFFHIFDGKISAYGRSESLKLSSRAEDERLLRKILNMQETA